jgi:hypothetical protein
MVGLMVIAGREGRAVTMPVRRDARNGGWYFRATVKTPDGKTRRIYGTAGVPGPYQDLAASKVGAQEAERRAIRQAFDDAAAAAVPPPPDKKEVPTLDEWFNDRFWTEWVIARKNKPSEVEAKRSIYKIHLGPEFGNVALDQIDVAAVSRFRAKLIQAKKSDKRINNILAVLSKALNYAEQARVITTAPCVGMLKVERPEIVAWSLEEYARLLAAAKALDPMWYAACCLAGEAGLRVGEIRALDWRRDVDLVAGTITVKPADAARSDDDAEGADAAHGAHDGHGARGAQGTRHSAHRLRDPNPGWIRDDR